MNFYYVVIIFLYYLYPSLSNNFVFQCPQSRSLSNFYQIRSPRLLTPTQSQGTSRTISWITTRSGGLKDYVIQNLPPTLKRKNYLRVHHGYYDQTPDVKLLETKSRQSNMSTPSTQDFFSLQTRRKNSDKDRSHL